MAVIKKTLFPKNLDRYSVLVNDTEPNSKYFQITELPDTFTGGKNAFLIAGSAGLVADTKLQIELKDAAGNVIYHEPGEGYISSSLNGVPFVTEYYEGVSKVVSVYVYPDTAYGPCTLTILGELSEYEDTNGITAPVPTQWENQYNVKWTKQINVNPNLANTTKIRFYQRPAATITELLNPIYTIVSGSKVASAVTQSFANIQLSQLETFAGDVKRVKVFRTSINDISDYELIQDILIESKELLTSYGLTGSVIGNTGIFTSEVFQNYWNTGSLNAVLDSERLNAGVRLTGSGYFTYTSSLNITAANTYELSLDAFYSSSTDSNLGIYLISGSVSSSIGTLYGTSPTKNLMDSIIPFKIDNDYPSASLYFSQSQGDWHLANISLKLSQDTAFSPDEVSFITTMPTVLGNETYNFKFEFYDVNNNYVPVAVTQSALFTGGNTGIGGTVLLVSSSLSSSLDALYKVSSSISGTIVTTSGSFSGSIYSLSGSVSGTIGNVSSSVSGTIGRVSGSISGSLTSVSSSVSGTIGVLSGSVSGSIYTLSGSVSSSITNLSASVSQSVYQGLLTSFTKVQQLADGNYSGSFISGNIIYAPVVGGQLGYFSTLFKVGKSPNSIYLDARQTPRKIFIGGAIPSGDTEYSGAYNNTNTNVYLDSAGKFSLGNQLSFDGSNLTVNGTINVAGGNAATNASVTTAAGNAATSASNAQTTANNALSGVASVGAYTSSIFTNSSGQINKTPSATASGLYLGSTYLGYYNGSDWKTYMSNTGNFYLSGTGTNGLSWDGSTLSITGNITVSGGNAATTTQVSTAQTTADNAASAASTAQSTANSKLSPGSAASDVNNNTTTISGGKIRTGKIQSNNISGTDDGSDFSSAGMSIDLTGGGISAKNFRITAGGDAFFKGDISGASGTFSGTLSGATITGGTISIGSGNSIFKADSNGIYLGNASIGSAPFKVTPAGVLTATGANLTGQVTATGGAIGGWTINGSQLVGSGSAGQIILDPNTPSVKFNNTSNITKLIIRTGQLSYLSGGGISFTINAFSVPSFYASSGYSNYDGTGSPSTVYIGTAGNYTGTVNASGFSNPYAGVTSNDFNGDLSIYVAAQVTDSSGQYVGTMYLGGASSYAYGGSFASYGYNTAQSLYFPAAGTYTITPIYNVYYYIGQGSINFYGMSTSNINVSMNPELDFGELTEYGLQVASSADQYTKIQRGSIYAMEAKGSLYITSPTGQFSYFDGVVHPYIGNKNDLGTTGNRWRSIWSNNNLNSASDRNLKNSIQDTDLGLEFLNKLRPVKYKQNWSTSPRYHYGLIAQEVTASLAEFGKTTSDVGFVASSSLEYTNEDIEKWKTQADWESREREISSSMKGELGLSYSELISPMIKAIQELSDRVIYLESKFSGSI